jgi:hypothetical protein
MYDEEENPYVIKAVSNGDDSYVAEKASVKVGEEINYYTEILGGDIQEGDFIVFDTDIQEGDTFHAQISSEEEE